MAPLRDNLVTPFFSLKEHAHDLPENLCLTFVIFASSLLLVEVGFSAIREDFESHTAVGETNLPAGWSLIDGDSFAGPEKYESATGSNGAGGDSGFAGSLNIGTFAGSLDTELPGAYIVHDNGLDPS